MRYVKTILKFVFAAFFVSAGVLHFARPEFFLKIMPDYIPQSLHAPCVYISGLFEIVLGALLLVPRMQQRAAWGLIALLIAVFPANIFMYQHQTEVAPDVSPTLLLWRLPLQGVMIALAYWYTRPARQPVSECPIDGT
jgi:uncharacterized membrane protein